MTTGGDTVISRAIVAAFAAGDAPVLITGRSAERKDVLNETVVLSER